MVLVSEIIKPLVIAVCLFLAANVFADEIRVKSFSMQMEPMTVDMQRKDNNGEVCALVKVIIPTAQATFEGNLIGRSDYKTSEYWCYLSPGSKQLKVKYPNCEPLMIRFDDFIGAGVKSKQIYELHLSVPEISSVEQNQKIYTISIKAHSSEKMTLLGKEMYVHMDSVTVNRYNSHGVFINSVRYDKGTLASLHGLYDFEVGAVAGDKFEVTAAGYDKAIVDFSSSGKYSHEVTLYPKRVNVNFILRDAKSKETLIGADVYKNPRTATRFFSIEWDNWDKPASQNFTCDESGVTDVDGMSREFRNVKTTDEFKFTYAGYKEKSGELEQLMKKSDHSDNNIVTIDLDPYEKGETFEIRINIGGMGMDDKGNVTVTNTRSGESFTMSQKVRENNKSTEVALGDELLFTRRGFRPVSVKFKYSIPGLINIAPLRGKKSDIQYLEF